MTIVQELSEREFNTRRNACKVLLKVVPEEPIVFFYDESHFHLCGSVSKQNCSTGLTLHFDNCIKPLCIHIKSHCSMKVPQMQLLINVSFKKHEVAVTMNS